MVASSGNADTPLHDPRRWVSAPTETGNAKTTTKPTTGMKTRRAPRNISFTSHPAMSSADDDASARPYVKPSWPLAQQCLDESVRVEVEQVVHLLAHADEEDGHLQRILDGKGDATA